MRLAEPIEVPTAWAELSDRAWALALTNLAVARLGRAVRRADVEEEMHRQDAGRASGAARLTRALGSLLETGDLEEVGRVRGVASGLVLFVPRGLPHDEYKLSEPISWLDQLAEMVEELWAEHAQRAVEDRVRPTGLTTQLIRERVLARGLGERIRGHGWLVSALTSLATWGEPRLRRVRGPRFGRRYTTLWVPAWVPGDVVSAEAGFPTDAARLQEAIRRAAMKTLLPVATTKEVLAEIARDPQLALRSRRPAHVVLADWARPLRVGGSRRRALEIGVCVGVVAGRAWYCLLTPPADPVVGLSVEEVPAARLWLEVVAELAETELRRLVGGLDAGSSPLLATARALDLRARVKRLLDAVAVCRGGLVGRAPWLAQAQETTHELYEMLERLDGWLRFRGGEAAPGMDVPTMGVPTMAPEAVDQLIGSVFAHAPGEVRSLRSRMAAMVRRVPNLSYVNRFRADRDARVQMLFDATDLMLYLAEQCGGCRARIHAAVARTELGLMRDATWVIAGLQDQVEEERYAAAACLAFLRSPGVVVALERRLAEEPSPLVRSALVWSLGLHLVGSGKLANLIREYRSNEADAEVRRILETAGDVVGADSEFAWWML
jgi:hypothetical protein